MGSVYALPSVTASLLKPVEPLRLFSYHGQFFSEFGCASVRLFKKPPRIFVTLPQVTAESGQHERYEQGGSPKTA